MEYKLPYKDRFVAFLDVLGFTKMVFSDNDSDEMKIFFYQTKIKEVLSQLKEDIEKINTVYADKFENDSIHLKLNYVAVSDSIVITIDTISVVNDTTQSQANDIKGLLQKTKNKPMSKDSAINFAKMIGSLGEMTEEYSKLNKLALMALCDKVALLQLYFASKDIWLRGAITSGSAYIDTDEKQIIGKAYINAYKLESKYAKYPRVILDAKLIKELKFNTEKDFIKFYNQNFMLIYDWNNHTIEKDTPLFISFISYIDTLTDEKEAGEILFSISKLINENIYDTHLYEKYFWLLQYTKDCLSSRKDNKYNFILKELNKLG